uniref:Ubiquitin-like protein ATG12 n=1 Tax=Pseudictyota dubia TaxID=2749911 RepID=A0A6U2ITK3_9STRA|mmetsp:Transcript_6529/g.11413  ORF Transcript_6529/g.11413 Transcript_6529/m.11413 type:complete len:165 (+) Transcript_6529:370-864(+)
MEAAAENGETADDRRESAGSDADKRREGSGDESSSTWRIERSAGEEGAAAAAATSKSASDTTGSSPAKPPAGGGGKVKVHFVAVGSAPLMKKTKFAVASDQRFAFVASFLRRMLKLGTDSGDSLFLYVNSAFVPSPDELLGDLNECFSVRGELVVHYALQEAWG